MFQKGITSIAGAVLAFALTAGVPSVSASPTGAARNAARWLAQHLNKPHIQFVLLETPTGRAALERILPLRLRSTALEDGIEALIQAPNRVSIRNRRFADELTERLGAIDREFLKAAETSGRGAAGIREARRLLRVITLEQLDGRLMRSTGRWGTEKIQFVPEWEAKQYAGLTKRFLEGEKLPVEFVGRALESQVIDLQRSWAALSRGFVQFNLGHASAKAPVGAAVRTLLAWMPAHLDRISWIRRHARWEARLTGSAWSADLLHQAERIQKLTEAMYVRLRRLADPEVVAQFERLHSRRLLKALK